MPTRIERSIKVRLICFAQLRDKIGASESALSLPEGATVASLIAALKERYPHTALLLRVSRVALNCEYVSRDTKLHEGDEVVIIPPVSGG